MKNVSVITNSKIQDSLAHLRDRELDTVDFRRHSDGLNRSLVSEVISSVDSTQRFVVVSILRAGVAMLPAVMNLVPHVRVGFAGLARDEKTAVAHEYYWQVPEIEKKDIVFITDPMLATGGSLLHVLRKLSLAHQVKIICVLAAPEGIQAVHKEFPQVAIYTTSVDEKLDNQKYIVPGLGDYGDRYFGSKA